MSIGLISENKIRKKMRDELQDDVKKFLAKGGEVKQYNSNERQFKPAYAKFTVVKQDKESHV